MTEKRYYIIKKCDFTKRCSILWLPFLSVRLNDWLKFLQYLCCRYSWYLQYKWWITYVPVRSACKFFAAKFEYILHSIYYVNHNVAEKILMIKELYKKENVCFCQSIFIQLVHVFNQMFVKKQIGSKLLQKLKSLRKYARAHSYWCTYMIKTQAAHQQFQSFVDTDLFEFILLLSFWIISEFHSLLHVVGKIC